MVAPIKSKVPGPGYYPMKNTLGEKNGQYILSTVPSSGTQRFGKCRRNTEVIPRTQVPGPGAYRVLSEFGHYEKAVHSSRNREVVKSLSQHTVK